MGNVCSIPSPQGIKKENFLDFTIISQLLQDVGMFNYYYKFISDHKEGNEMAYRELVDIGLPFKDFDAKKNARFASLIRDITDIFNIISVNIAAKSFTNV